ncbi:hypothetical protein BGX38DRAFT_1271474 [Terfezia claveryi]|nr:hypothetical protein BGX38DRAFT_1271474 [Terfezia claveryi]
MPSKRKTQAELAIKRKPSSSPEPIPKKAKPTGTAKTRKTRAESPIIPPPARNPYAMYADFNWGPWEFNPDTEFSGGRKATGLSIHPHTKKIREQQQKLLGPPLAWERAKDWKRQKVNRDLKGGIQDPHQATHIGRPIGTLRCMLKHEEFGKLQTLVQRTWEDTFQRKKAYILYQWYELSDEQKRRYLELEDHKDLPNWQIPRRDLPKTEVQGPRVVPTRLARVQRVQQFAVVISVVPINRHAYAKFEEPIEGDAGHKTRAHEGALPKTEVQGPRVVPTRLARVQRVQQFAVVISVVPINRHAYAKFEEPIEGDAGHKTRAQEGALSIADQEELAEGGADDCLSDEDVGTNMEEDSDDKPNKEDDDEDTGLWRKWEALDVSSEEEAQLTEADSNERRPKKPVKAILNEGLLSGNTEDEDYRDSSSDEEEDKDKDEEEDEDKDEEEDEDEDGDENED